MLQINPDKGDGSEGLKTDHFKNVGSELSVQVILVLSGIIAHGTVSDDFQVSTVMPIPKGKKR